jgi:hypothetical protein
MRMLICGSGLLLLEIDSVRIGVCIGSYLFVLLFILGLKMNINMAEGVSRAGGSQESCERKEVVEKSCARDKCLGLELQLKEALLELSSAQLVIEILRKGQNVSTSHFSKQQKVCNV